MNSIPEKIGEQKTVWPRNECVLNVLRGGAIFAFVIEQT